MGFTETLRLLVDADTKGAVRDVEKLGATSERELSKSEKALDKWGNRLTSVGAGMATFGVAALGGLGAMAMASEEARLSTLKLENTIENMPKLAGASKDEFIDLAESIQKVTAADADAIVEGQALLGTFNLTAQEIKGITPLVVDYARKFGVDIPDAAVQVGKALDGQVGALKRNGVSIDEALFKTDRYRAVQEALSDQVGGFAEAEGKTFAGSLQRLKNQLGDLSEGVGAGAVDAFTTMGGAVEGVTERLNEVSPGAQEAVGKFATFGAVGLVAAGGLSMLIGQAMKARENFAQLGSGISSLSGKVGGVGRLAGIAAGAVGIGGLVLAARELNDQANKMDASKLAGALNSISSASQGAIEEFVTMSVAFERLDSNFAQLAENSVPAAERFIDVAESMGVEKEALDRLRDALEEKKQADIGGQVAQEEYSAEVQAGTEAVDGAIDAIQTYADALRATFDPLFAVIDAENRLNDANAAVTAAEMALAVAIQEHGAESLEAMAATEELRRAQIDAAEAAVGQAGAIDGLRRGLQDGSIDIDTARTRLDEFVRAGLVSAATAAAFRAELDRLDGKVVNVTIRTISEGGPSAVREFHGVDPKKRARGGPVSGGRIYEVGEAGEPEMLTSGGRQYLIPAADGHVTPMSAGGGAGGGHVTLTVQSAPGGFEQLFAEMIRRFVRVTSGGDVQSAFGWSR